MKLIKNFDRDKYELDFDYSEYKALPDEGKDFVRRYFSWSRTAERWVSKAKINGMGGMTYWLDRTLKPLLTEYEEGEEGEKKTQVEKLLAQDEKDEKDKEYWLTVTPGYTPNYKQYAPPSSWYKRSERTQMYPHDYEKEYLNSIPELLADARRVLKVSTDDELPDRAKDAVLYHLKGIAEYQGKSLSAWEYAPSVILVGPGGYPRGRAEKGFNRRMAALDAWKESRDKFEERLQKIARYKFGLAYKENNTLYLRNRIDEATANAKRAERAGNKEKAAEYFELAKLYQEKLVKAGGSKFSKQELKEQKATHVLYGRKYYPIERLNDKTITIRDWGYEGGKFMLEYDRIQGFKSEPDAPDVPKKAAPLKSRFNFKKGDLVGYRSGEIRLSRISKIGIKYIKLQNWPHPVKPERLIPLETVLDEIVPQLVKLLPPWVKTEQTAEFAKKYSYPDFLHRFTRGAEFAELDKLLKERLGHDFLTYKPEAKQGLALSDIDRLKFMTMKLKLLQI